MDHKLLEQAYQGQAPWDTGQPQPAIIKLAETGQIRGHVINVGCGTGENLIYLAAQGHEAWGLDFVPVAIERAKAKAVQRGVELTHFIVGDALELKKLHRQFDTVIDCGLFHAFADEERPVFVKVSRKSLGPGDSAYSLLFGRRTWNRGAKANRRREIRDAFRDGWKVRRIEPTRFESISRPDGPKFSPGGPKAWLATMERT